MTDTFEPPFRNHSPATPDGDAISAVLAELEKRKASALAYRGETPPDDPEYRMFHGAALELDAMIKFVDHLRSLPPQDGEGEIAELQGQIENPWQQVLRLRACLWSIAHAAGVETKEDLMQAALQALPRPLRLGAALTAQPVAQEPVAWLPTATVRWLLEYDGPACATKTAAHNRPLKSDGGVPVYLHPAAPAPVMVMTEADKAEDEAYQIGYRDGYEEAVAVIDRSTGGDGEYYASTIPGEGCPGPTSMIANIVERFTTATPAPVEAGLIEAMERHLHDIINCGNCSGSRHSARQALAALRAQSAPMGGEETR